MLGWKTGWLYLVLVVVVNVRRFKFMSLRRKRNLTWNMAATAGETKKKKYIGILYSKNKMGRAILEGP